jgi:hypothetical protein
VSVVNESLSKIGDAQIEDLQAGDNTSAFCNALLASSLRKLFGLHNWNCVKKRMTLSPLVDAPNFGYSYQFQIPENFSKIVSISSVDYSLEGDKILSNETILDLVYIFLPEDATSINPSILRSALVTCLAAMLAIPLAGSNSLANRLNSEFVAIVSEAKIQNDNTTEISEEYVFGDGSFWTVR